MRLTYNSLVGKTQKSLVTIQSGRYPVIDPDSDRDYVYLDDPTHGLIVEHVGIHVDGKTSCWHILVDNNVLLVWDDNMEKG
jgi:hypothetical protein